jgi:hypothetical protein
MIHLAYHFLYSALTSQKCRDRKGWLHISLWLFWNLISYMLVSVRPPVCLLFAIHTSDCLENYWVRTTTIQRKLFCVEARDWTVVLRISALNLMYEGAATLNGIGTYFITVCAAIWNMFKLDETMTRQIKLAKLWSYVHSRLCVFLNCKRSLCKRLEGREGELEVYLYSFSNLGTEWRLGVNTTAQPLYPGKDTRYSFSRRLVWTVAEHLAPTGVWTPVHASRSVIARPSADPGLNNSKHGVGLYKCGKGIYQSCLVFIFYHWARFVYRFYLVKCVRIYNCVPWNRLCSFIKFHIMKTATLCTVYIIHYILEADSVPPPNFLIK